MNTEDMTILVAAIFQAQFVGRSAKENIADAKEFVRVAERMLEKDRKLRSQMAVDAVRELVE